MKAVSIAAILSMSSLAEQMPVMKLNDRRELQNSNSSCNQLTCYYPTVFDWEKCTCVITLENCDVPQEVCDDSKQWSVDDWRVQAERKGALPVKIHRIVGSP